MGITTYAPRDIYGPDAWFSILEQFPPLPVRAQQIAPPQRRDGVHNFVHWSFLSDSERSAVHQAATA